jgi:hypothetical protein
MKMIRSDGGLIKGCEWVGIWYFKWDVVHLRSFEK